MKKEKYGWACGYEKIYGSFHDDNERCTCKSRKLFDTKEDAIRASMKHVHSDSVYVYSANKGYVGLSVGLAFYTK
jgi:hypothetical protein